MKYQTTNKVYLIHRADPIPYEVRDVKLGGFIDPIGGPNAPSPSPMGGVSVPFKIMKTTKSDWQTDAARLNKEDRPVVGRTSNLTDAKTIKDKYSKWSFPEDDE